MIALSIGICGSFNAACVRGLYGQFAELPLCREDGILLSDAAVVLTGALDSNGSGHVTDLRVVCMGGIGAVHEFSGGTVSIPDRNGKGTVLTPCPAAL